MRVLKFGGSSLADENSIKRVSRIVATASQDVEVCVVLSAMKGVTDSLISCARLAESGDSSYKKTFKSIRERHCSTAKVLVKGAKLDLLMCELEKFFNETRDILHGIELLRECSRLSLDLIMSFGERLICLLFSDYLASQDLEAEFIDARQIIITDSNHGQAAVLPITYAKIREKIASSKGVPVITGFIASTAKGITTTLGRNGSDYTASLIGAGVSADMIEIWTDVDGVMSADPTCVDGVYVIPELSYQEAMELSYFGAEVIHPHTMIPATRAGIPILIKNTFNPEAPGTLIACKVQPKKTPITGIASIEQVALVNMEGGGMMGVPGIAARILGALARSMVNIVMISQASSEHSICLVFKENESVKVEEVLRDELARELETGLIQDFEIVKELVIIAVIGENMRGTPGISGRLFSALGAENINVLAIAQGSSERNISIITSKDDRVGALNAIHRAFLGSSQTTTPANSDTGSNCHPSPVSGTSRKEAASS